MIDGKECDGAEVKVLGTSTPLDTNDILPRGLQLARVLVNFPVFLRCARTFAPGPRGFVLG